MRHGRGGGGAAGGGLQPGGRPGPQPGLPQRRRGPGDLQVRAANEGSRKFHNHLPSPG